MNDSVIWGQIPLRPSLTWEDSSLISLLSNLPAREDAHDVGFQKISPRCISQTDEIPGAPPDHSKLPTLKPRSFEDPFEDPNMEPLPLGPVGIVGNKIIDLKHPVSSCTEEPTKVPSFQPRQTLNGMHNEYNLEPLPMIAKGDPTDLLSSILETLSEGSKRKFIGSPCPQQQAEDPMDSTDQTHQELHHQYEATQEENIVRFRPYQENQWRTQFEKLVEFKRRTGHCCVPHSYPEDPVLARWVKKQRYQKKKMNENDPTSTMTSHRIEELESIGFVWHSYHAAWLEKLNELKAFKEKTGHCKVPSHYPENAQLSTWVKRQRRQYKSLEHGKSSNMTSQRFDALEKLGFVFDIRTEKKRARTKKNSHRS